MKRFSKFSLSFLVFGLMLSCARTPQQVELHPVYAMPRGTPLGPSIYLGVAEGIDAERIRKSTVRVVYGEGPTKIISSGFFVASDKIVTCIHVVATADLASLHVRSNDASFTIRGVTAFDVKNDLVILQVSGEGVPLVLGDSDAVRSGETLFSVGYVGYPVDRYNVMKNTVLPGQLNDVWLRVTPNSPAGNSGGPVLNTEAEVIGINVMGSGPIDYVIGSNVLKELLDRSGAVETLTQWQTRDPIRSYLYLGQASERFYATDYAGAIHALDKFIELNPMHVGISVIYSNRGYAKTLLGHSKFDKDAPGVAQLDYRAAIQDLNEAINLNPEDITVYANRGHAKTYLGHTDFTSGNIAAARHFYQQAIGDLDKVLTHNQTYPPIYTDRGVTKVFLGLSQASQGRAATALGYYSDAIEDFNKALSLDPADAYTYGYTYGVRGYARICLGYLESGRGNTGAAQALYKGAVTDANSALRLNTENPYYYHTRGVAKAVLDDYSGALEDFDKTVSLKPDFARAYYNRALVKVLLGQKREAKTGFKKAKKLDSDIGK